MSHLKFIKILIQQLKLIKQSLIGIKILLPYYQKMDELRCIKLLEVKHYLE